MSQPPNTALTQEWCTLQNNFTQYERSALWIKLTAIVVLSGAYLLGLPQELSVGLGLLLWLQESIYRTTQSRLGERIVRIEALVQCAAPASSACQLHTEWRAGRRNTLGLLGEYAVQACRPTVAFPYAVLLLAELLTYLG